MAKNDKKKKKIKVPDGVLKLRMSPKKFAKKQGINTRTKGLSKKEKKRLDKRLTGEYADFAITNLSKAVRILADHDNDEGKKISRVKEGVENIIFNHEVMERIAKLYRKDPTQYPDLIYLPFMITNTITFFNREDLSEEDKALAGKLDVESLIKFCEKILKKPMKVYMEQGISPTAAFQLACVMPSSKKLKTGSRHWYKRLIQHLYVIAETEELDMKQVFSAITKLDKKKGVGKKDLLRGFFGEFILSKASNRIKTFNDTQKELHEALIESATIYMDSMKPRQLKEMLKAFIKHRKVAEEYKNDSKRIIKFIDFANSNSEYTNIRSVVSELISDNSNNELYLG